MPKHIARLTLLIVAALLLGYAAKRFLTGDSFYQYGHYRGASVVEVAAGKPKYSTPQYCEQCHSAQYADWSKGVHNTPDQGKVVKCEACHGPAGSRDVQSPYLAAATGKDHPDGLKMTVSSDTTKLCTLCHEQMSGRPAEQKQIVVATHAGSQQCTSCHNAHSPKTFKVAAASATKGDTAAGKAAAAACAGCHGEAGVAINLPGPSLAGQQAAYLAAAIKAYKSGERDHPMMSSAVKDMGDGDIENVAAYYAGASCKSAHNGDKKAEALGAANASQCAACHGAKGISAQPAWPSLAGLSKDYLVSSFNSYKTGGRKNGMMAGIAKNLSDADTDSLAAYFANAACR